MKRVIFALLLLGVFLTSVTPAISPAFAAERPRISVNQRNIAEAFDSILDYFRDIAKSIGESVETKAVQLFWLLAGLELTWAFIDFGIKGELGVSQVSQLLIRETLVIGLFRFFLASWRDLDEEVVRKLVAWAGSALPGLEDKVLAPNNLFAKGVELAQMCLNQGFAAGISDYIVAFLPACVILVSFCMAGATCILYMFEGYVMIPMGVVLLGMGSLRWTRNYAEGYLKAVFALAMKFFFVCVVQAGVLWTMYSLEASWSKDNFMTGALLVSSVGILSVYLTKAAGDITNSLLSGSAPHSGGATIAAGAMSAVGMAQQGMKGMKAVATAPAKVAAAAYAADKFMEGTKNDKGEWTSGLPKIAHDIKEAFKKDAQRLHLIKPDNNMAPGNDGGSAGKDEGSAGKDEGKAGKE